MKFKVQSSKFKVLIVFLLVICLTGCEAFVRKFTRKSNKEVTPEEMVLAPEEYKGPNMTKEQLYRQYLLYWKSWQDELINALMVYPGSSPSLKKQVDCANEAVKNLDMMKAYLNADKQKALDNYINQLKELKDAVAKDSNGISVAYNRRIAEQLRRNILRDFSFNKIKGSMV